MASFTHRVSDVGEKRDNSVNLNTWKVAKKSGCAAEVLPSECWVLDVVSSERRIQLF